ncbi:hypothetical protein, partial [Rossellomorea marisflavi]|uniref:hypothetical protein n=1 Tax=Rossellomorea marisflavi TaxID=189381 RepID=UPI003D2EC363
RIFKKIFHLRKVLGTPVIITFSEGVKRLSLQCTLGYKWGSVRYDMSEQESHLHREHINRNPDCNFTLYHRVKCSGGSPTPTGNSEQGETPQE